VKLLAILLALLFVAPAQAADKHLVPSWGVNPVTYYVAKYPTIPAKRVVDRALYAAFESWSQSCDLKFSEVKKAQHANIVIWFDPQVFGGMAQLPAKPLYLGQSNIWLNGATDYNQLGATYLQALAGHEIGHSIGLWHSVRTDQLMSPTVIGVSVPQWEDKQRVVKIYGAKP
jgi:predicted Zn-dependent protease